MLHTFHNNDLLIYVSSKIPNTVPSNSDSANIRVDTQDVCIFNSFAATFTSFACWYLALSQIIYIFFSTFFPLNFLKKTIVALALAPSGRHKDKQAVEREGRKSRERKPGDGARTREFKAGAAAPAQKREKPVIRVAGDLGASDAVLRRRTRQAREGLPPVPGRGAGPAAEGKQSAAGARMKS
jgi:hypothetical protein